MREAPQVPGARPAAPVAGDMVAAVTVYRPDEALLGDLLERLAADGCEVLVAVDGPAGVALAPALLDALQSDRRVDLLQRAENGGLGAALNLLAAAARARRYRRILFFDQDSAPPAGLAAHLSAVFDGLDAAGLKPAIVGPLPVALPGHAVKPPRYRRHGRAEAGSAYPVDYLITSGSLVDLDALTAVGPFREDFWIDAIDTEWCFRAFARGYGVFCAGDVVLPHRIGGGVLSLGPVAFPRQSEARMLTYVRNQAHSLRLRHVPRRWKLRLLAYLPLQALVFLLRGGAGRGGAWRLLCAFRDGLAGRLGRPRP